MGAKLRSDLNVTPLVDIVFVLLIVFITLMSVLPRALPASLPGSGSGPSGPAFRLALRSGGTLELEGRAITLTELPGLLRGSSGPVVLRVDPSLPFHRATEVMDVVKGVRPEARLALVSAPEGR
ncbi:MAG TPA: biopolymer transporter ExbD [Holophagaceae bacterium]